MVVLIFVSVFGGQEEKEEGWIAQETTKERCLAYQREAEQVKETAPYYMVIKEIRHDCLAKHDIWIDAPTIEERMREFDENASQ